MIGRRKDRAASGVDQVGGDGLGDDGLGDDGLGGDGLGDDGLGGHPVVDDGLRTGPGRSDDVDVVLSEEQLRVGVQDEQLGSVRARKHVDTRHVEQQVSRGVEQAETERVPAVEGDSGQVETLPDGSVSIPVFEEEIVVTKRLVVRERVVLRKHTVYEDHLVQAELRRERLEVETDGDVRVEGDLRERD